PSRPRCFTVGSVGAVGRQGAVRPLCRPHLSARRGHLGGLPGTVPVPDGNTPRRGGPARDPWRASSRPPPHPGTTEPGRHGPSLETLRNRPGHRRNRGTGRAHRTLARPAGRATPAPGEPTRCDLTRGGRTG